MDRTKVSINHAAPDLLLDKVAEVAGILAKSQGKGDSYKFWSSVNDTMKLAWAYIQDLEWIVKENGLLRAENQFLKSYAAELQNRLDAYETIRTQMAAGTLEETIEKVNQFINNNSK